MFNLKTYKYIRKPKLIQLTRLLLLLQKKQLSAMLDEDPTLMEKRNAIAKRLELYKHARDEIDSVGWK